MLIEITINAFIALITNEDSVVKYFSSSSSLESSLNLYVTRFIIYTSICIEKINFILFYKAFGFISSLIYELEILTNNFGRLTLVYTVEHYEKTVKDICKALKDKFEAENVSDADKNKHIEDFIVDYMVTSNNLDETANFMRIKVIKLILCNMINNYDD